ncbi:BREX-2 system adenine-specific DNA-methyltransferase PglX [Schlesneria sp.]|uniref:BREX-2 system adenine-specific DNA-methyltransferase PglX n=1 Tax=Schlesneria sp. TaxID=2762018 RepID=UPI002EDDE395
MINRQQLLSDLQSLLKRLETDLQERSESSDVPEVGQTLRAEYDRAKNAERTAENYEDWRSGAITQTAAAWVLSCVFVRFLEDNQLIDPPKIAGPNERLQRARDEHELYFRAHPKETDREYLLSVFNALAELPGTRDVFGRHNPLRELPNWLSGDAAGELLRFFQKIDANTGLLVHDFADPAWDTRFLGDLYQDLSEAIRKRYALLQTPEFVEEFILERTLEPALDEFGLDAKPVVNSGTGETTAAGFRMIDPACGSGHFLLGSFRRILDRWLKREPATNMRELVQRALNSVHGVDLNPYAVAISRFRLLLAAMRASGTKRLCDAPDFHLNLACGDSLLHGPGTREQKTLGDWEPVEHSYLPEDLPLLRKILYPGIYHAVVANPPYITPKDRAANEAYRRMYPESCHMKYSLAVPFMERLFRLAIKGRERYGEAGGFTGQITANSFMKREFGKKMIEVFFPTIELTHVIDTSGAYIPGHGTPTVILLGRNRSPVASTIRAVMGIRGEPTTPDNPAQGLVWSAIVNQIDEPGSQSEFVSVSDSDRDRFHTHPWSIGGGGAAELKESIEASSGQTLGELVSEIGVMAIAGDDDVFIDQDVATWSRRGISNSLRRSFVTGDDVRDWNHLSKDQCLFPYDSAAEPISTLDAVTNRYLWSFRSTISAGLYFGKKKHERAMRWYEYAIIMQGRVRADALIHFAAVATHNHFALAPKPIICNRHSPVIKLPDVIDSPVGSARPVTEDDYFALLGLLNSSSACFWMKQVGHNKGDSTDQHGARTTGDVAFNTYEYTAGMLSELPLPAGRPITLAKRLDELAQRLQATTPAKILAERHEGAKNANGDRCAFASLRETFLQARERYENLRGLMIFLQEELDWACYKLYGLIEEDLTYSGDPFPLAFGERSFEILLARSIARGAAAPTTWFERHNATPRTDPPAHWPDDYVRLYHRRHDLLQQNPNIGLIEQPEYKRRWNTEPWDTQLERALREWLLDRLESYFDFDGRMNDAGKPTAKLDIALVSVAKLADIARQDTEFQQVGELYREDPAFDVQKLVEELVAAESVPLLPILRYKESGLRKRAEWEKTWELQRQEDRLSDQLSVISDQLEKTEDDGERKRLEAKKERLTAESQKLTTSVPVPPKYTSADFISTGEARYWSLRGKLDVPKERWISLPYCEGNDGTLMLVWGGYDQLQQARAISAHYVDIQERLGGRDDPRLVPLLACLIELLPWLKQWHNEVDPEYGVPMGDYFEGFINEEARNLPRPDGGTGWTLDEIKAWEPPKATRGRGRRRAGT